MKVAAITSGEGGTRQGNIPCVRLQLHRQLELEMRSFIDDHSLLTFAHKQEAT
jgi:hypothetical protein